MPLILLALVTLLLCNGGFTEHQRGDSQLKSDNNDLKIIDLNSDVLYIIFSHLDVEDLLSTVEAFPEFHHLVHEMFRRKYSTYEVQIKKSPYNTSAQKVIVVVPSEKRFDVLIDDGIRDFDSRLLYMFGYIFQKIKIEYLTYPPWETVTKFLNKYCSDTVKRLELKLIDQRNLNHLTGPFKEVEEFSCSIFSRHLNVTQPLNQLFPKLLRLDLELYIDSDYSLFECELPHLEHLKVTPTMSCRKSDQIKSLMQKNPNIRSIEIVGYSFPSNYIEVINQLLPNITNLTMTWVNIKTDFIRFDNVKNFNIVQIGRDSIGKLFLPNLKSIQFIYDSDYFDEWHTFFQRHSNITHLQLGQESSGNVLVNELLNDLPNLVDVSIECVDIVPIEHINIFIENHSNLKKLQFSFREITTDYEIILRERFKNEWRIHIKQHYNMIKGFSFERY